MNYNMNWKLPSLANPKTKLKPEESSFINTVLSYIVLSNKLQCHYKINVK